MCFLVKLNYFMASLVIVLIQICNFRIINNSNFNTSNFLKEYKPKILTYKHSSYIQVDESLSSIK